MWRIRASELEAAGFDLSIVRQINTSLQDFPVHATHINVLEFVAIIVNLWFMLHFVRQQAPPPGGHVVAIVADNTSALSWLRFAARQRSPPIRHLALFCHSLLTLSQTSEFLTVEPIHIPGQENSVADILSRPEIASTLDIAIEQCPPLQTCHACQVPYALLSYVSRLLSATQTGDQFVQKTTELLTVEPTILPLGAHHIACHRGFSRRSHRGIWSR
jgi:hypothetical protein